MARSRTGSVLYLLQLVAFWVAIAFYVGQRHYALPIPSSTNLDPRDGSPRFNEVRAMEMIRYWSEDLGYRIVGTQELVDAETYLLKLVEGLKMDLEASNFKGTHEIEIWHQRGSGAHRFDFMGKRVWKKYIDITNVIVRISNGTQAGKENAVLVNAHLDSTLPSPGAADDLVGVAVMVELIRLMTTSPIPLYNSVIFLFNSAEESLQDASHLYITQHETRDSVRSVINLEACGVAGPEILFQATSEEMIRAYSKAPYPYGTVLASEVFATGLIVSDTDFRQFEQYGNLTGLDMALVKNSYLYHTRKDLPDEIEAGALTHMADNGLAILRHLTSPEASLAKIEKSASTVYFSLLGGLAFVMVPAQTASTLYISLAIVILSYTALRARKDRFEAYMVSFVGVALGNLLSIVAPNVVAFITASVLRRPLNWYRNEAYPVCLFLPASLTGLLAAQHLVDRAVRCWNFVQPGEALLQHITLIATMLFTALFMLTFQLSGILSSYIFAVSTISNFATLLINDVLTIGRAKGEARPVSLIALALGQILPFIFGVDGLLGILDLFVPLSGRLGPDVPADHIMASIIGLFSISMTPMLLPLAHRIGRKALTRVIIGLVTLDAIIIAVFCNPSWPTYDAMHQKRIFALHMTNLTDPKDSSSLLIATLDNVPDFIPLLESSLSVHYTPAEMEATSLVLGKMNDYNPDWDIVYPIGNLLQSVKLPLPSGASVTEAAKIWTGFTVEAVDSTLNAIKEQRTVVLEMRHPGIMWAVIAFTAEVVAWDLPAPPEKGRRRHHVKEVGSKGVESWRLKLTIQLSPTEFQAALRSAQRRKGQRSSNEVEVDADNALARLRIDYSGLDEFGMWPAKAREYKGGRPGMDFMKGFDAALPDHVDAMLLTAVGGVVVV